MSQSLDALTIPFCGKLFLIVHLSGLSVAFPPFLFSVHGYERCILTGCCNKTVSTSFRKFGMVILREGDTTAIF